jgi:hypothetical protein
MAPADRAAFNRGNEIARAVLAGEIPDPVRGGTFFYSSDTSLPPGGAMKFFGSSIQSARLKPTLSTGKFTFLKDMIE